MKLKRINNIENYINEKETASLTELSEKFDVSLNTIRRDVKYLTDNGAIKKVYGGVTSTKGSKLTTYDFRTMKEANEKRIIAKLSAQYIEDGDFIFIDSGTTTVSILENVDPHKNITVLTSNLGIINEAVKHPNISLMILGTNYHSKTQSFINPTIDNQLENYNITKAFMATTGLSIETGVTNSDYYEYEIKKEISKISQNIYILADSTKFSKVALMTYLDFDEIDKIFTDSAVDSTTEQYCSEHEIEVIYPSE